jgi:hypothetical protein
MFTYLDRPTSAIITTTMDERAAHMEYSARGRLKVLGLMYENIVH